VAVHEGTVRDVIHWFDEILVGALRALAQHTAW
jgi:hypothetical protein